METVKADDNAKLGMDNLFCIIYFYWSFCDSFWPLALVEFSAYDSGPHGFMLGIYVLCIVLKLNYVDLCPL